MGKLSREGFVAIVGGGACLLAMATAGHAHAAPVGDTSGFFSGPAGDQSASAMWVDIAQIAPGTKAQAESLAHTICGKLADGTTEGEMIAAVSDSASQISSTRYVIHAAEWHFCPSYY